MLEFSSPLRSSGFLSSNYTEVLPDASHHCQTKNHVSAQSQSVFQDLEMLFYIYIYIHANAVLKFHSGFLTKYLGVDEAQSVAAHKHKFRGRENTEIAVTWLFPDSSVWFLQSYLILEP